jgi:ADP-heptose:LPS heptosyltransferase
MEYVLLLASAAVSRVANLAGGLRRRRPARILVVKLDHMGDVVTATPVFRALREAFPSAAIDALVGSAARDILAGNPFVSRILTYDSPRFRREGDPAAGPREIRDRMRAIAAARYTHIVELRGDGWTLRLPFLCGALRRVDRGTVRIGSWLARRTGARAAAPPHEVETNLAVVRPWLAGRAPSDRPEIFLSEEERGAARERLAAAGIDPVRPYVAMQPGAAWRPRAWRAENFAAAAARLSDRHNAAVVFLGGAGEADLEARLRGLLPGRRCAFFFGAFPLRVSLAVLAQAALVVGNDSGPVHAAAALGVPVVALFGPQLPERFRPWSPRAAVLHHRVDCCPCAQRVCVRPDDPCVDLITLDEVEAAAARVLEGSRP